MGYTPERLAEARLVQGDTQYTVILVDAVNEYILREYWLRGEWLDDDYYDEYHGDPEFAGVWGRNRVIKRIPTTYYQALTYMEERFMNRVAQLQAEGYCYGEL